MKCSSVCLNKSKRSNGIHFPTHRSTDTQQRKWNHPFLWKKWCGNEFAFYCARYKTLGMSFNGAGRGNIPPSGTIKQRALIDEEKRSQFDLHLFKNIFIPGMTEHLSIMNSNSIFYFLFSSTRATSKDEQGRINGRQVSVTELWQTRKGPRVHAMKT